MNASELKVGQLLNGWDKITFISDAGLYGLRVFTLTDHRWLEPSDEVSIELAQQVSA